MTPINCHQKGRDLCCGTPVTSFRAKQVLLALVALLHWTTTGGWAALLQGCDFSEDLCDNGEVCLPDGLFGQCYSDEESVLIRPLVLERYINDFQSELLRAELTRLAELGLDWPDARAQCVLAYFKLAVAFQLDYDTEFCTVRNPENIWALVQKVQNALLAEVEAEQANVEDEAQSLLVDDGAMAGLQDEAVVGEAEDEQMPVQSEEVDVIPILVLEGDDDGEGDKVPYEISESAEQNNKPAIAKNRNGTPSDGEDEKRSSDGLSAAEVDELDQFVHKLLKGRTAGPREMGALSERQLSRLAQFIRQLQNVVQNDDDQKAEEAAEQAPEELPKEEAQPGLGEAAQGDEPMEHVLLLKKDSEQFNNADMGLANTVHKIVKGGIQRVEGNRVYLKVTKEQLTEQELYKLIAYLDKKIAQPNNLYFDEFLYENGQLSFRISRLGVSRKDKKDTNADSELDNASGVAQAVYKRRKDIQTLAGIRVDETGIGSGLDVVPVERSQRDWLFVPIMTVSALTICTLVAVLAVNLARMRRRRQDGPIVPKAMPSGVDGGKEAGCSLYEDLCRHRVAEEGAISHGVSVVGGRAGGDRSKHSSTSSWPDECAPSGTDQLDIGTGHVLLTFLKEHLEKPGEVNREWESVKDYANAAGETKVARRTENATKNVDATVLPYDDSLISLHGSNSCETLIDVSSSSAHSFGYYNASKIFDADPEPTYIVAQAPQEKTVATFWQMAWEQGVALLVNLCDKDETKSGRCVQYWPEEGSKAFGNFEVHLVSEHIWSEHYVVRSLYLKNSSTNETRTVTQFHFLSWPSGGMPESSKALLEFRRKVNKSYRGRASPVLVHCWNGADKSGCYCLIDIVINRIQKGVKELNIAASLEHLRDQRMGMVKNEEQFKFVFVCVAEEVSSRLKSLQQQQQQQH